MTTRPDASCDAGCNRGWIECGGIEDDETFPWVQMCDSCTSDGHSDDMLAAAWARDDTGLPIELAIAFPNGEPEAIGRPYLNYPGFEPGAGWHTYWKQRREQVS